MSSITSVRAPDRRGAPRAAHPFDGQCSSQSGYRAVRICDLSATGCFVESIEPMLPGQRIELRIDLPESHSVTVVGSVVYGSAPMGFGVRFLDVAPEADTLLRQAVNAILEGLP
jgi:hypothetical protein